MTKYCLIPLLFVLGACGINPSDMFAKSNSVTIQAPEGENAANAPMKIEVTPVASVENAVRPAQGPSNSCPPGAPILYRGNMMCPDRF